MRPVVRAFVGALALLPLVAAAQDFDPSGRRHRPRPPPGHAGPRPSPRPGSPKGPSVDVLIARYTGILLKQPSAAFPLQKLTELYRKRDGKLDQLIADFEQRAAQTGPDQFNAKLALAGIYGHARRRGDAKRILTELATQRPKLAAPRLMLAGLAEQEGDAAGARGHYEAALPLQQAGIAKEKTTRTLMKLCLDLKDYDAAKRHHEALVRSAGGSLYVKKELGSELMARSQYGRAEVEFRALVKASAGDNRALAPALRDLGHALAKQKKLDEALTVLKRARRIAGTQAGIRAEILALLTEVFREQGKLVELIAVLESEGGRDHQRLATIGALYEETGQVDKALETYRAALKLQPRHIDTRVKLVHLLQTAGQLEEAIREYEALIQAAPHNADFVFELAETLIQRGNRDKALKQLADLERRAGGEPDVLAAVADFYERIEEPERAVKVFERLAKTPAGDPQYIIDLGDRYYQAGKVKRAKDTWVRIRSVVRNRARASAMLGEVYLEHDMPDEALAALREATKLAPTELRYRKALATALERTASSVRSSRHRYAEALEIWEDLLGEAGSNALLEREARTHIVSLWAIMRQLPSKVAPLRARLHGKPPDLVAGRLLAEVQRRLQRLDDAEQTLRRITKLAPGDESSLLALERILVMQRDLDGAIDVLKKLVEVNPKGAREYYQRMASYAAEQYRDDDAIRYAARAVELSPNDAVGHHRLGKMYRRRQEPERAMAEFRKAIAKNDRLFAAYFDLAELLLSAGKVDPADRLYRRVVRACRDEQYVARAARLSMQINLGRGSLESLERELLPVALGNPQKKLYRRLLVELYGAMTFPLVHAARYGTPQARRKARSTLTQIGARAVKPLLDALADDRHSQQRIAIEVLAYVQNRGAGPALFNFATGQADRQLRVRAMVACGALDDPGLLPRYEAALLGPEHDRNGAAGVAALAPGDAVAVAAAWGVARMNHRKAERLLLRLLESPSPEIRSLAAIGLGMTGQRRHAAVLAEVARSPESGPLARAAAAHALGELGDAEQRSLLLALAETPELNVKLAALLALSRLQHRAGHDGTMPADVSAVLARALLSEQREARETALAAATAVVTGEFRRDGAPLPVPDGAVLVGDVLRQLAPSGYQAHEQARALLALAEPLTRAARAAVATSPERAHIVAELIQTRFASLTTAPASTAAAAPEARQLDQLAERLATASVPGFVALARHPSVEVRKRAIEFLASRRDSAAQRALVDAIGDAEPAVAKAALSSVEQTAGPEIIAAMVALLRSADSWALRARAAEALGRVSSHQAPPDPEDRTVDSALQQAALEDSYALVREAAIRSLVARSPGTARSVLERVAKSDAEPRLRTLARKLASPK